MTKITQLQQGGNLSWDKTLDNFTGNLVTDKDNYIYALVSADADSGQVRKYDSDGNFVDSVSLSYSPNDISYGYDRNIYTCGSDSGGDGHLSKITTGLVEVATKKVTADSVQTIRADKNGNTYVVLASKNLKKYGLRSTISENSVSYYFSEEWNADDLINSGSVPRIAITENGNIYATKRSLADAWGSTNDPSLPSYWGTLQYGLYDSVENEYYESSPGGGIEANQKDSATWYENFRPSKAKFVFDLVPAGYTKANFLYINVNSTGDDPAAHKITPDFKDDAWQPINQEYLYSEVEIPLDWTGLDSTYQISSMGIAGVWDEAVLYLSDVQFYTSVEVTGVAAFTTDGESVGFFTREQEPTDIILDKSGRLVILEGGHTITMVDPSTEEEVWSYDTGTQVETFITSVDGTATISSMTGRIEFSADVVVGGDAQEASVVFPPSGNIEFSQPAPTIEGYQTNIYVDPSKITFQSDAGLIETINVSAGAISLSGEADTLFPIEAPPGGISVSGSFIESDIEGYQTTIKATGNISFQPPAIADTGVWIYQAKAPTYGSLVLNAPPTMQVASVGVEAYTRSVLYYIEADRPMFEMDAHVGASMESEFPALTLSADGTTYRVGHVNTTLPVWNMTAHSGGYIETEVPVFTLDMAGNVTRQGFVDTRIPIYQLAMTGSKVRVSQLEAKMPALTITMTAIGGQVGSIDASFPMFDSAISAIVGGIGGITATLPTLRCKINGIHTGDNDLEAKLPMLYIEISSGAIETEVLRYVKGKVR